MQRQSRLWLCVAPLVLFACDFGLTVTHQPDSYWQGDYASVNEGNPLAHRIALFGPLVAMLAALCYALAFCAVLIFWRNSLVAVGAFLLTLGHAIGAGGWLWMFYGTPGLLAAVGLLIVADRLLGLSWERSGMRDRKTDVTSAKV